MKFKKIRLSLQCAANILIIIGFWLTIVAMFTSGWLVAYEHKEYNDRTNIGDYSSTGRAFEYGLYRDCVLGQNDIQPSSEWVCFWKYDQNNHIQTNRFFNLREFHVQVLVLLGVACCLSILTSICSCVTCCLRYCSIPWAACAFFTSVTAFAGVIVFAFHANISSNRFYRVGNYEQDMYYGMSFYLAIGGVCFFALVTGLAVLCVVLSFLELRQKSSYQRNGKNFNFNNRAVKPARPTSVTPVTNNRMNNIAIAASTAPIPAKTTGDYEKDKTIDYNESKLFTIFKQTKV